jgi:hypothetical protein
MLSRCLKRGKEPKNKQKAIRTKNPENDCFKAGNVSEMRRLVKNCLKIYKKHLNKYVHGTIMAIVTAKGRRGNIHKLKGDPEHEETVSPGSGGHDAAGNDVLCLR